MPTLSLNLPSRSLRIASSTLLGTPNRGGAHGSTTQFGGGRSNVGPGPEGMVDVRGESENQEGAAGAGERGKVPVEARAGEVKIGRAARCSARRVQA